MATYPTPPAVSEIPVPVDEGGTGESTASAAFAALKQDATTSATGVVELATTAEVDTGTDATRAITPDALNGSAPAIAATNITGLYSGLVEVWTQDFSALGSADWSALGSIEVNGVTWTIGGSGSIDTLGPNGTTGLAMKSSGSPNHIALSTLLSNIPGASATGNAGRIVFELVMSPSSPDNVTDLDKHGIQYAAGSEYFRPDRFWESGANKQRTQSSVQAEVKTAVATQQFRMSVQIERGGAMSTSYYGVTADTGIAPGVLHSAAVGTPLHPDDVTLVLITAGQVAGSPTFIAESLTVYADAGA